MLRDVLRSYLNTLTEREFDALLLAMLDREGFFNVAFIHGQFEFGKDFIAQRRDDQGTIVQYSIQSKAGNIDLAKWRSVRPQLEEAEYNVLSHPNFDESAPRVAVLATTGRLTGAAPADSQQFRSTIESRGLADFEVWDQDRFLSWLERDPSPAIAGQTQTAILEIVSQISAHTLRESDLEKHTRSWFAGTSINEVMASVRRGAIEAAIIANLLRLEARLDLAAEVGLCLFRATCTVRLKATSSQHEVIAEAVASSSLRLFGTYVNALYGQVQPHLAEPRYLADATGSPMGIVTYPATLGRLAELFAVASILGDGKLAINGLSDLASDAVAILGQPSRNPSAGFRLVRRERDSDDNRPLETRQDRRNGLPAKRCAVVDR